MPSAAARILACMSWAWAREEVRVEWWVVRAEWRGERREVEWRVREEEREEERERRRRREGVRGRGGGGGRGEEVGEGEMEEG